MTKIKAVRHDASAGKTDGLVFELDDGRRVVLSLDGDCCSGSYFEERSVEDAHSLVGEELRAIAHASSRLADVTSEYGDLTQYHAVKITTDKQEVVIDWRNESNGYYDGWCDVIGFEVVR